MTLILIAIVLIFLVLLDAAILFGLSKLFKISTASYKKSLIVVLEVGIFTVLLGVILAVLGFGLLANLVFAILGYLLFSHLFRKYYQTSWGKSFVVYITHGIVITIFIALPLRVAFQSFIVSGQSMSPHLNNGNYILIEKYDKNYQRDDAVVMKMSDSPIFLVKRIIGLPLEKVEVKGGQLFLDGNLYQDQYISPIQSGDMTWTLSNDEYFVLGDNTAYSKDSRSFGPIKSSQIVGKVFTKVFGM